MASFEQTFKNIDDLLFKDSGADSEIDYIEQTSWILFLKYLDSFDQNRADEAILEGQEHQPIFEPKYQWEQLREFQKVLDAEESDIYDILSYVAYNTDMLNRRDRVAKAKQQVLDLEPAYQEFLDFVMQQYISKGVEELDDTRLKSFLELKYSSIHDAKPVLGDLNMVRQRFIDFQQYLYN